MRHKILLLGIVLVCVLLAGQVSPAAAQPEVIAVVGAGGGPADTTIKAGSFAKRTSTGPQVVTGVGFKPKLLLLFGVAKTSDGVIPGFQFGFGAADGLTNKAIAGWSWDSHSGSDTDYRQDTKAITFVGTVGVCIAAADLSHFDDDGFTLNWTTNNASAWIIYYLAIGGGAQYDVSSFTASAGEVAYTHVGFKPDLLLLFSAGSANGQESSFGFADGDGNQFAMSGVSADSGINPTDTARYQRTDKCLAFLRAVGGTSHVESEASFVSMNDLGFTLDWEGTERNIVSVAISGIKAKVGSISPEYPGGDIATTGAGFQPKGALFAGYDTTASTSIIADNHFSIGVADTDRNQGSIWVGDRDNVSDDTQTDQGTSDNKCYIYVGAALPSIRGAVLSSWDPDGFTLTWDSAAVESEQVGYLLLGDYPSGPVAPVGGIAEAPPSDSEALADHHGSSGPNALAFAGLATGAILLLAAGGWYARRRWI